MKWILLVLGGLGLGLLGAKQIETGTRILAVDGRRYRVKKRDGITGVASEDDESVFYIFYRGGVICQGGSEDQLAQLKSDVQQLQV